MTDSSARPYLFDDPSGSSDMEMMQEWTAKRQAERQQRQQDERAKAGVDKLTDDGGVAGPEQEQTTQTSTGENYAQQAARQSAGQSSYFSDQIIPDDETNWVYRRLPTKVDLPAGVRAGNPAFGAPRDDIIGGIGDDIMLSNGRLLTNKATVGAYTGELAEKVLDPEFRNWLARRAMVVFQKDLFPDDGGFDMVAAGQVWSEFGNIVASNPYVRDNFTPEMYADKLYNQWGGDNAYDKFVADLAEKENPITTTTRTSTTTMQKASAEALVDELSRGLLGRMANDKELARYRAKINAFLKSNPQITTEVTDRTDPNNVTQTVNTKAGATAADAASVLEMKLRRGSEGMAFNVGQMWEDALSKMDRGL